MKKIIAALLCLVMMFTFVPTAFAAAGPVEVAVEAQEAAGDSAGSTSMDFSWLADFVELFTGLWDKIGGETILLTIKTIFTNFLEIVSIGEFFDNIKAIWNDVK